MAKIHIWVSSSGKDFAATVTSSLINFSEQENFAQNAPAKRVRTGRSLDAELMRRLQEAARRVVEQWAAEQTLF